MPIIRIQHSVPSFEGWKRAFDADPMDRNASGVHSYRVYRSINDPLLVMLDLDVGTVDQAETLLQRLHELWAGPGGSVMRNPQAWVIETVESKSV